MVCRECSEECQGRSHQGWQLLAPPTFCSFPSRPACLSHAKLFFCTISFLDPWSSPLPSSIKHLETQSRPTSLQPCHSLGGVGVQAVALSMLSCAPAPSFFGRRGSESGPAAEEFSSTDAHLRRSQENQTSCTLRLNLHPSGVPSPTNTTV